MPYPLTGLPLAILSAFHDAAGLRRAVVNVDPALQHAARRERYRVEFAHEEAPLRRMGIEALIRIQPIEKIRIFRQVKHGAKDLLC